MSKAVVVLLRVVVGGLLVYAALAKLADPPAFAQDVANYRLLPAAWVGPLAAALLGVELVVGGALVAGLWVRAAALVALTLLAVFSAALMSALLRGISVECGCFGAGGALASWQTVGRDIGLLIAAGFIAWRARA